MPETVQIQIATVQIRIATVQIWIATVQIWIARDVFITLIILHKILLLYSRSG